jgi:DNA-binding GntR family transcriptional regulator
VSTAESPSDVGAAIIQIAPIGPRLSLADEVAVHLRRLILTGHLKPGERIDQEAISRALAVSRSPIREAIVVLGQEGLVKLNPNRGACVAEITPADITEHYEMFGAISGRAAALAADRLSDDELLDLAYAHREFAAGSPAQMSAANHRFHRVINSVAPQRTRWLLALLERAVPADYYEFSDGLYTESVADHQAILDALIARDSDAARWAMEHHLRQGGRAAVAALARQGFWKGCPS